MTFFNGFDVAAELTLKMTIEGRIAMIYHPTWQRARMETK